MHAHDRKLFFASLSSSLYWYRALPLSLALCTSQMQHRFEIANIRPFVWFSSWAINDLIGIVCSHFIARFLCCAAVVVVALFLLAERAILANLRTLSQAATKYISAFEITLSSYPMCFYLVETVHVYPLHLCLRFLSSPFRTVFDLAAHVLSMSIVFAYIRTYCIKSTIGIEMRWCGVKS